MTVVAGCGPEMDIVAIQTQSQNSQLDKQFLYRKIFQITVMLCSKNNRVLNQLFSE